ncbi:MAG: TlpA family protein disulfide reductase [Ignavibacteriae bacterium]|nr:TlpA family protein disulfide reductase [Ignavibacteriota bacterium]
MFTQSKKDALPPVDTINHVQLLDIVRRDTGKVHLVNVWATWCVPCKKEIPVLLKLCKQYSDKGLAVLFVSADELEITNTKVRPLLKQFGIDFPTYIMHDSTDDAFITGMSPNWSGALPTSFLYDRKGKLVEMMVGERKYEQFEKVVRNLIVQ